MTDYFQLSTDMNHEEWNYCIVMRLIINICISKMVAIYLKAYLEIRIDMDDLQFIFSPLHSYCILKKTLNILPTCMIIKKTL